MARGPEDRAERFVDVGLDWMAPGLIPVDAIEASDDADATEGVDEDAEGEDVSIAEV